MEAHHITRHHSKAAHESLHVTPSLGIGQPQPDQDCGHTARRQRRWSAGLRRDQIRLQTRRNQKPNKSNRNQTKVTDRPAAAKPSAAVSHTTLRSTRVIGGFASTRRNQTQSPASPVQSVPRMGCFVFDLTGLRPRIGARRGWGGGPEPVCSRAM